jgi:DnaK suppressor protein
MKSIAPYLICRTKRLTSRSGDRAAQEEEFSLELRNRDRERKLIKKIEKTLKKVEDEDFGYCESCGVEIGIRRLEARPTADLCIDCKTLAEIREKQMAG